ncbi:adenylate cyclase, class 2 (thermophilic) [Desulfocurvibacter africanus PCS]|uniref:Adenylate cyclase, class 2 (Thermophilic) n=2 Tax=Desulfocurvibacter africanus TaxID=873 RepID=M5PY84_DESAF|nr:adenylate cyclase, class 2 (thermophilic) [Desulfocurvibacter africanus PCS]
MALETELKFCKPDFGRVHENLSRLGADFQFRALERNLVLDDVDSSLRHRGMLLRLRQVDHRFVLTFKRPPTGQAGKSSDASCRATIAKVLEEIETSVTDFQAMQCILEALGYRPAFTYEKVREKWLLDNAVICLDRLPFGRFVEIEAEESEIFRLAADLGLDASCATSENYHELNRCHRQAAGLPPEDSFVFSSEERARMAASPEI